MTKNILKVGFYSDFFYYICNMWLIKKYNKKRKIKSKIYQEFEKALEKKDFVRTGILSKRFLKIK